MLIGLTGPSGSHKTKAAKHLQRRYGFKRMHIGQPVKDAVQKGYNLTDEQIKGKGKDNPASQLGGHTPRSVLEGHSLALHTTAPAATSANARPKILKKLVKGRSVVVDGVRSPVEEDMIRKMGGTIIRMDNGEGSDPAKPMDKMQEDVRADHKIDSSKGKDDITNNVDQYMMRALGVNFNPKARMGAGNE